MSWGSGSWGVGSPWGTGEVIPSPSLLGVTTPHRDTAPDGVVDAEGGDLLTLIGDNFAAPMTVEIMLGAVVYAPAFIGRPAFDIKKNKAFVACPPIPDNGSYGIRVTTEGGSAQIDDVLTPTIFARETKTEIFKKNISWKWKVGRRLLMNASEHHLSDEFS